MTREDYIQLRTNQSTPTYVYNYYLEHIGDRKPKLDEGMFFLCLQQWDGLESAMQIAQEYFDVKFEVMKVFNKQGKLILLL